MPSLAEILPHRVALTSPLSPADCLARLKEATNPYWQPFGPKPARRWIHFGRVSLFATAIWTSHVPLTLSLKADGAGTRLDCRVGLPWALLIAMGLIVALIGFAAGGAAAAGVAAAPILVLWLSGLLTVPAHRGLIELVASATDARPIGPSTVT